jgi:tetratricopeptide (TPR) repeat protein
MMDFIGRVGVIGLAALCFAAAPVDAQPPPAPRQLLEEALRVRQAGDLNGARAKLDAAIRDWPDDAPLRTSRSELIQRMLASAQPQDRRVLLQAAQEDLDAAIRIDPEGPFGGIARDNLRELHGRVLLPPRVFDCPVEARRREHAASEAFVTGAVAEALRGFEAAVHRCPDDARLRINYGNVFFAAGDMAGARQQMLEGVQRDAWNRTGHRFLTSVYLRTGDRQAAYRSAMMAVLSDPTYNSGWSALREVTLSLGGRWHWQPSVRAVVVAGRDAKPSVVFPREFRHHTAGLQTFWLGLSVAESAELGGAKSVGGRALRPDAAAALDRDRARVEIALDFTEKITHEAPAKDSRLRRVFAAARQRGLLDEAIFLHLLDERLAREYPAFRERRQERLVDYLSTLVAPTDPHGFRAD